MRLEGKCPLSPYSWSGFSPQAIFRRYAAPGNFMAWTVLAGTLFRTIERPPKRFDEPGRICSVVTPPARARENEGSCTTVACSAQTLVVFASLPALTYD